VLIGIGIGAIAFSVIDYLMTRAQVWEAQTALLWLTGSLSGASAGELPELWSMAAVLSALTLLANRSLSGLQLGDDTAAGLGLKVERSRLLLIVLGVALSAVAVAATGPVGFVAFVAGPIARRLTGGSGGALLLAGLVGALVVVVADFAGQHLMGVQLPVGVLTAVIGAPYLLYLLVVSNRIGRGG
jgi:iron complex transport system permease protein